jgi:hypothetical protein
MMYYSGYFLIKHAAILFESNFDTPISSMYVDICEARHCFKVSL